jgi:tetratricopeptide (TPR) repeat protein
VRTLPASLLPQILRDMNDNVLPVLRVGKRDRAYAMLLQLFTHAAGKLGIWRGEACSLANQALANAHQPTPCPLNLACLPNAFRDRNAVLEDYEKSLALRHNLVRIDPTNAQWRHDEACILHRIGDEYCRAGLTQEAVAIYEVSVAIWRELAKIDSQSQTRDLAISLGKLGDAKLATADAMGAMAAYEEAATNWRRLVTREPDNTYWQMKLAEILEKLGDLELETGDTTEALKVYEELVRIDRGLLELAADNVEWQWNLSLSLDRIGDVQFALGNTNAARFAYEKSLAMRRSLLEADTSTSAWQEAVSSSLRKKADVERLAVERAAAQAAQTELRGVHRLLFEMDQITAELEDRLSITVSQIEQAKTSRNLVSLEESLTVRRQLAVSYPTNHSYQYDLSAELEELADLTLELGDRREAFQTYQESLAIRRHLAETAQNNRELQQALCITLEKVGALKETEDDHAAARLLYEESVRIRRRIIKFDNSQQTHPASDAASSLVPMTSTRPGESYAQLGGELKTRAQFDLVLTLKKLAHVKLKALDSSGALAALEESLTIARQLFRAIKKSYVISKAVQNPRLSLAKMSTESRLVLEKYRTKISALLDEISIRARAAAQASNCATEMVRHTTISLLSRHRKLCSVLLSQISLRREDTKLARAERTARLLMKRLWRRGQKQGVAVVARAAAQRLQRAAKTVRVTIRQLSRRQRQRFAPIQISFRKLKRC